MATPRETIAAQLAGDQAGWDVYNYPFEPSEVRKTTAVIYRTTLAPITGGLQHDLTLQVYGPGSLGAKTETDLDTTLDAVMLSLQRLGPVQVRKAERKTFGSSFQGWEFELTWLSSDIYKAQV